MEAIWRPHARLWQTPPAGEVAEMAEQIAGQITNLLDRQVDALAQDPGRIATTLGWRYSERPIGQDSSTIESLLVPLREGGFSVVINERLRPSPARTAWLMAHEIGHSMFYAPGPPPRRIVPVTVDEERFCDQFADSFIAAVGLIEPGRVGGVRPVVGISAA